MTRPRTATTPSRATKATNATKATKGTTASKATKSTSSIVPAGERPIAFVQASIRKPNTAAATRFECYKVARTLREARALGASLEDIKMDIRSRVLVPAEKLRDLGVTRVVRTFAPDDDMEIAFAANPKKPRSKSGERYGRYSAAKSMKEAKSLGIWPGDIANDIRKGYLGTSVSSWAAVKPKRYSDAPAMAKKSKIAKKKNNAKVKSFYKPKSGKRVRKAVSAKTGSSRGAEGSRSFLRAQPLAWSRKGGWA